MDRIKFDFNNMFESSIGAKHGVTDTELKNMSVDIEKAYRNLTSIINNDKKRVDTGLEWVMLPGQRKEDTARIQKLGDEIASLYENVISLGIGGSYLGLKAAQDALAGAYYNEFSQVRGKRPKVYFDGNNLDPDTLGALLRNLDPKKTFVIVISKSGETTETKVAFTLVEEWLKKGVGAKYGRQIFAITDPKSGTLREKVNEEQSKDPASFRNLPVLKGVGGRFSELNIGLLHLAIIGVKIQDVLDGAGMMKKMCLSGADPFKNPAIMYAALHTILFRKKNKPVAILMPFSETLKSTADWYVQLLAESLGKKCDRSGKIVNTGRTPVSARGTNDLHSIQQNNIEGENNKAITFIKVEKFARDITMPDTKDFLARKKLSELLLAAEEATEWALVRESRPSCTITMPCVSAVMWGALIFFFEMATAIEGELLNVNAFDQPGVEGYKNYMYYKLGRDGLAKKIADEIKKTPLKRSEKYVI